MNISSLLGWLDQQRECATCFKIIIRRRNISTYRLDRGTNWSNTKTPHSNLPKNRTGCVNLNKLIVTAYRMRGRKKWPAGGEKFSAETAKSANFILIFPLWYVKNARLEFCHETRQMWRYWHRKSTLCVRFVAKFFFADSLLRCSINSFEWLFFIMIFDLPLR